MKNVYGNIVILQHWQNYKLPQAALKILLLKFYLYLGFVKIYIELTFFNEKPGSMTKDEFTVGARCHTIFQISTVTRLTFNNGAKKV